MSSRKEHLEWCKQRALEYVQMDDLTNAFTSFHSDMGKHPETQNHVGLDFGMRLLICGRLKTKSEMENYINGYN